MVNADMDDEEGGCMTEEVKDRVAAVTAGTEEEDMTGTEEEVMTGTEVGVDC